MGVLFYSYMLFLRFGSGKCLICQDPVALLRPDAVANQLANDSAAFIWKLCRNRLIGLTETHVNNSWLKSTNILLYNMRL